MWSRDVQHGSVARRRIAACAALLVIAGTVVNLAPVGPWEDGGCVRAVPALRGSLLGGGGGWRVAGGGAGIAYANPRCAALAAG